MKSFCWIAEMHTMSLREHVSHGWEVGYTWVQDADKELPSVVGMGHETVQFGEVIV